MRKSESSSLLAVVLSIVVFVMGCGQSPNPDLLTKLNGTEDVVIDYQKISMSPSGRYILFITHAFEKETKKKRKTYGVSTIDLETGLITKHKPSGQISPKILAQFEKQRYSIGFTLNFDDVGWSDGFFFFQYSGMWLRIDPGVEGFSEIPKGSLPNRLTCSDRIPLKDLAERIRRYRGKGNLKETIPAFPGENRGGTFHNCATFAANGQDSTVCFVGISKKGNTVFCSDGKTVKEVCTLKRMFGRAEIWQVRLSPDGRYLAILLRWALDQYIPFPSAGFEVRVIDMADNRSVFKWSGPSPIGSCLWDHDGENLYIATEVDGKGIYKLRVEDFSD